MPLPGRDWPRIATQLRGLLDRSALGLLIGLSVLLMLLGKADMKLASYLVERGGDAAVPVLRLLGEPVAGLRAGIDRVASLLAVYQENERLREENRRLLAWQSEAARLAVQNRSLRAQVNLPPEARAGSWITARVVADARGVFVRSLLVDAGAERGVRDGMAAVTPSGLVGRVTTVGCCSARVLLITDFDARIPVVLEHTGAEALLVGDNGPEPALDFLPPTVAVAEGDLVLTSGRGGLLPPGLLIGRVVAPGPDGPRLRPFVDLARLDYLSLLDLPPVPPP